MKSLSPLPPQPSVSSFYKMLCLLNPFEELVRDVELPAEEKKKLIKQYNNYSAFVGGYADDPKPIYTLELMDSGDINKY